MAQKRSIVMRLNRKIVVLICLALSPSGWAERQQPEPAPASPTGQAERSGAPQGDAQAKQTQADQEKESATESPKSDAKTELKKSAGESGPKTKTTAAKRRAATAAPAGAPRKVVVRQGGVDEPAARIVPGMSLDEANRQRRDTEQLLKSADDALRRTDPHAFDQQQQETVSQIHNYMTGAESALKQGDIARAHTLAVKAGLLADDLARR